jgi:hypothetical protein
MRTFTHLSRTIFILSLLFCLPGLTVQAAGATWYVTPTGSGDCSDWEHACSLQTALDQAVSHDEVWVASGVYHPTEDTDRNVSFVLPKGAAVYGGFAGDEMDRDARNPLDHPTILSGDIDHDDSQTPVLTDPSTVTGNSTNSYHVVTGSQEAYLDGFTITAGYNNAIGAGVYSDDTGGGLVLAGLVIRGNVADEAAGMYNEAYGVSLTGVDFLNNLSLIGGGGGMVAYNCSLELMDVTFDHNTAADGNSSGGGLSVISGSLDLTDVDFRYNSSGYGGGLSLDGSESALTASLTDVRFETNTADWEGGGLSVNQADPILSQITFLGNLAMDGAGMYGNEFDGSLTDVDFILNLASGSGGGLFLTNSNPLLTRVSFLSNQAYGTEMAGFRQGGGGMFSQGESGSSIGAPVLTDVTFYDNHANIGGGLYAYIMGTLSWQMSPST